MKRDGAARRLWDWSWERLDTLTALVLAVAISIAGLFDKIATSTVATWTLATLAVVAFALMRDRSQRSEIKNSLLEIERAGTPESIFKHASNDVQIISEAQLSVDLLQETGSQILESAKNHLVRMLKSGGSVRIVLTKESEEMSRLMALRNWDLTPKGIQDRWSGRDAQLESLCVSAGPSTRNLEVRYIAYPVGATLVAIDAVPPSKASRIRVREAGFRVTFDDKPDFDLRRSTSPVTFDLYKRQFDYSYLAASKLVVLEGEHRSGKTSMIASVLDRVGRTTSHLAWAISEQILDAQGQRTGFKVLASDSTDKQFAAKNKAGGYDEVLTVWDEVASFLLAELDKGHVLVIDEIGPIQLKSPRFRELVDRLSIDKDAFVVATASDASSGTPPIQESYRAGVITLSRKANREAVIQKLETEIIEALRTRRFLKGNI